MSDRPTEAQQTEELVRRHLAAILVVAQEGSSSAVLRMMRAEMCRLVSAICTCMRWHKLDSAGRCPVCDSASCALLVQVRRALLPVQLSTREQS